MDIALPVYRDLDRAGMAKGWTIGGLYADLTDALGKDLDLVTTTGANDGFLSRIQSDTVILYQRSLDKKEGQAGMPLERMIQALELAIGAI